MYTDLRVSLALGHIGLTVILAWSYSGLDSYWLGVTLAWSHTNLELHWPGATLAESQSHLLSVWHRIGFYLVYFVMIFISVSI